MRGPVFVQKGVLWRTYPRTRRTEHAPRRDDKELDLTQLGLAGELAGIENKTLVNHLC